MSLFHKEKSHKVKEKHTYDSTLQKPMIKASICNGEQVVGFKDLKTGHFEEVMFIREPQDLKTFREMYGITEPIGKEY